MWFLIILWKLRVSLKNARGVDLSYLKENLSIVLVATNFCIERRFRNIIDIQTYYLYWYIDSWCFSPNDLKKILESPNCRMFLSKFACLGITTNRRSRRTEPSGSWQRQASLFQGAWGPSALWKCLNQTILMQIVYVCYSIFFFPDVIPKWLM